MNNEDMLLIKSAIALNMLLMEKNEYEKMKTINDKDSTRIIKLIQSTLKQNLYSKLVSTSLDSEIIADVPKNIYERKLSKSFTTIDTMLAIRNFQKKNSISAAGRRELEKLNRIGKNELSGIEKIS